MTDKNARDTIATQAQDVFDGEKKTHVQKKKKLSDQTP